MTKPLQLKNHYEIDGIAYPRITTVCGFIDQKGGLPIWAAKLGFEAALNGGESGYEAYQKELDRTSNFGSAIHHEIANYFETGNMVFDGMTIPIQNVIRQFLNWKQENSVELVSSDALVYSQRLKVAGTLDLLCLLNGCLTLIDFKTSSDFHPSMLTQPAGYDICLRENGLIKYGEHDTTPVEVVQYGILRLPREGDKFECLLINHNLEELRNAFFTCKQIFDYSEKTKNILKEAKKEMRNR